MSHAGQRQRVVITLAGLCLVFAGCVTERAPNKPGLTYRDPAAPVGGGSAPLAMPTGPIATPAPNASTLTSRVQVPIVPLGQVVYDGQVLPLVSPDGRTLAVQQGESPSWSALVAAPDAVPPVGTRLAIYALNDTGPAPVGMTELPEGVILGRGADDRGFLVEWLREDSSRWIGRVPWTGGNVDWLVKGVSVCAHAIFTPQGELVFTRATAGGEAVELVLRRSDGGESVRRAAGGAYAMPQASDDGSSVFVLRAGSAGLEIEVLRIRRDIPDRAEWGAVLTRRAIAARADRETAYQIMAAVQGPMPTRTGFERSRSFAFLEPAIGRMAILDLDAGGTVPLVESSFAAARWQEGYLCATPKGLIYTPAPRTSGVRDSTRPPPLATIVDWPAIPRVLADGRRVILVGPSPTRPEMLTLARIEPSE
ncbi:MAG: hypothetical protein IPM33_12385 [Phycisphaerales bacterium]|nr:hypothetical protein [Phycisphaerales bacterium]